MPPRSGKSELVTVHQVSTVLTLNLGGIESLCLGQKLASCLN